MIVVVDIDHVLSDAFPRDSMLEGAERWDGWDSYHLASVNDRPVAEMVELVNCLVAAGHHLVAVTSRPDKWRGLTLGWFVDHGIVIHELLMRADEDYRSAVEIKTSLVRERYQPWMRHQIGLVIDDRDDVCAAFRSEGITTLQVSVGRKNGDDGQG
jgi:hypothetical protein